ncbi:T9SS type A sorting domain-containing protein [bacterium]
MKKEIAIFFLIGICIVHGENSDTWIRTGGPLGGLGYDVRMRPDNPDMMYVTDAYAGVFISEDGGENWHPSNQGITTGGGESGDAIPVFCLTIDPHHHDIIWIGMQFSGSIFKSVDAGVTWEEKDEGVNTVEGVTFRGFTVDPTTSDIVYAAAELSSWSWNNSVPLSGREFDKTKGVIYKTENGGENWTEIWRGNNLARYVWVNHHNPDIIYISTGIFDREAADSDHLNDIPGGEGIVKSTDGGKTWENVNIGLQNYYVGSLFMHPEDPNVLLAGTGNNAYGKGQGIYLTENGGVSWQRVLLDDNINAVEFALSEPHIAYAGSANAIYRSEDRGMTWEKMSQGYSWGAKGVRAGFPIDFQVDPRNANRIFANNYGGGNFLSIDGGKTWTVASRGYTGAQARDIAVDPENPAKVYCAARSGMFVSSDGGEEWQGLNENPADVLEWNVVAIDPADPQHVFAGTNWDAKLIESQHSGMEWQVMGLDLPLGRGWRALAFACSNPEMIYGGTSAFFSAGVFDPVMDASGIAVSMNSGKDWAWINDENTSNANVQQLAVDPVNPQIVFAATGNKGLFKTVNGGESWNRLTEDLPNGTHFTTVAVDPFNSQNVFTAVENAGLYLSENGGGSWKMITAGLILEMKITDVLFDPTNPEVIYLSDIRSGVYQSVDGGDTWMPLSQGLRTRAVNALAISSDGQHLYAATEGEGVFRIDLNGIPVGVEQLNSSSVSFLLKPNYPNPFNQQTAIRYQLSAEARVEVKVFDLLGHEVSALVNETQSAGEHHVIWDALKQSSGTYLIQMRTGNIVQFQKCVLLK